MSQKHPATIKELAASLGVSVSTVSRALQDDPRIGLRTKMRVQEMARALNYQPNQAAVQLRKGRTQTVGVLLPWLREEFFSTAITGIEDVMAERRYHAVVSQSRDETVRERTAVRSFTASRVDGVIASMAAETADPSHFNELQESGIPVVFFDRAPQNMECHAVRSDVAGGVQQAMRFLVERGVKRVALLNGPDTLAIAQERLEGFRNAATHFGLDVPPEFVQSTSLQNDDTRGRMRALLNLPERPQAVLAFNDYVALDAMLECRQAGLQPNKDLAFVSFANLPVTSYLDNPPLASVEQFAYEMGARAAQLLLKVLEGDLETWQNELVRTELVVHC